MSTISLDHLHQTVAPGISLFIKLQGLIHDPNPLVWSKWLADESECKEALEVVRSSVKRTATMLGKQKYQHTPYDPIRQVRSDVLSYLTTNQTGLSATLQKRNLPVYYAVIDPLLTELSAVDHTTLVDHIDLIVDHIKTAIDSCTEYGTYQDALIAQDQIRSIIRTQEELAQQERDKKKRKKKGTDPLLALLAALDVSPDENWDSDEAIN